MILLHLSVHHICFYFLTIKTPINFIIKRVILIVETPPTPDLQGKELKDTLFHHYSVNSIDGKCDFGIARGSGPETTGGLVAKIL